MRQEVDGKGIGGSASVTVESEGEKNGSLAARDKAAGVVNQTKGLSAACLSRVGAGEKNFFVG